MAFRVAINGMGRIGRAILRGILKNYLYEIEVPIVNDINLDVKQLVYLLKYDSTGQGLKNENISMIDDASFDYNGKTIYFSNISDIANIPLAFYDVDIVFDCTGKNTTREALQGYLDAGAKNVILCCPPQTSDIPQFVYGVNHKNLSAGDNIISISSCSNQAIATLLNPFIEKYGIEGCVAKVIRSYTNDQNLMDNVYEPIERGRAAAVNIIPTTVTGYGKIIGAIIPSLRGKVIAQAFRTPTILGGAIDLTINLSDTGLTVDEVNTIMEGYSIDTKDTGCFKYSSEKLVSSDVIGDTSVVTYLSSYTLVNGNTINIVGLYDNENGFAAQAVKTAIYMSTLV